MAGMHVENFK